MSTRRAASLLSLVLCLACGTRDAETLPPQHGPIRLTIKSDKHVYAEGAPIDLVATLTNTGKAATRLYSPEYWGVSDIVVEDSRGVRASPRAIKADPGPFAEFLIIPPGEARSATYVDLIWFSCGGAQAPQLAPGVYTIHVILTNPPVYACAEDPTNPKRPFETTDLAGRLTSNTITLRIDKRR